MPVVTHLEALEILDSRGRPTVQATCVLDGGVKASASVPSGTSPGRGEALELRDGDLSRYHGLGCRKAAGHVEGEIRAALLNKRFADQNTLDRTLLLLDGTENKSRFGANAVLAVSVAFARAHAAVRGIPLYQHLADILGHTPARLPRPVVAVFAGGAGGERREAIRGLALVPGGATIDEALAVARGVLEAAAALVARKYQAAPQVADDGALAPPFAGTEAMLEDALEAARTAQREPGREVSLVVDLAASQLHDGGWYRFDGEKVTAGELIDRIAGWVERHAVVAVTDGLAEDDWEHWPQLARRVEDHALVSGDDLLCTNPARIKRAAARAATRGLVLKPNQVGTLMETAEALRLAREAGWIVTASARGGETEDDWLADLAVGWGVDLIQIGSLARSDRLAKYNRLLAIEKRTRWPVHRWPAAGR
jgi:enolase